MISILKDNRGGAVVNKIVIIAIAAVILLSIYQISVYVKCQNNQSMDRISINILNSSGNGSEDCKLLANQKYADATKPNTASDGTTGEGSGGESSSGGDSSVGPGSSIGDGGGTIIFEPPPEGYVPISYYDSKDINLTCSDSNSYYQFEIPTNAPPGSYGTKTLTVNNKRGWNMWMKITKIDKFNGLDITNYQTKYQAIPDDGSTSFQIKWHWNKPSDYTGKKGGATVYFNTVCTKPATKDLYTPKPGNPKNLKVKSKTENTITLTWDEQDDADVFQLYRSGSLIYQGNDISFIDKDLTSGTSYSYSLRAKNSGGLSSYVYVTGTTTGKSPIPSSPKNFKIVDKKDTSTSLKWDEVSGATTYSVRVGSSVVWTGNATTYEAKNLTPGTYYTYYVRANNSYGSSSWVSVSNYTTGESPYPNPPSSLTLTPTETTMNIKWSSVEGADEYEVTQDYVVVYRGPNTEFTTTGLNKATWYYYNVKAIKNGNSSSWRYGSQKTLGESDIPTSPSNFKAKSKTNHSIELTWNPVAKADYYILERSGTEIYRGPLTTFNVTGLNINTSYSFYVYAANEHGKSSYSYLSTKTANVTYDDETDISNQCQDKELDSAFNIPLDAKVGDSGKFEVLINNTTNQVMTTQITNINKLGALFEGDNPTTLETETSIKDIPAKSQYKHEIIWTIPANYGDNQGKTGAIVVYFNTKCK